LASIVSKTRGDTKISERKAYTPLPKSTRATERRMKEEEKQMEDGKAKIEKNHVERRNRGRAVNERDVQGTGLEKKGELRRTAEELNAVGSMALLGTFLIHLDSKVPSRRINTRSTNRRTNGILAMVCEGTSADFILQTDPTNFLQALLENLNALFAVLLQPPQSFQDKFGPGSASTTTSNPTLQENVNSWLQGMDLD
jgi:hypothetical protein